MSSNPQVHNIGGKEPDGKPACIGRWTFQTQKVRKEVESHLRGRVLNACAGKTKLRTEAVDEIVRNDINEDRDADTHFDVCEIAGHFDEKFDVVVFDPPFDQKQADELYSGMHARDVGEARKQLAELVTIGGTIVELGWSMWGAADYFDGWDRDETHVFRRGIPDRPPVFVTVDTKRQMTLSGDDSE
jgi:hypothetical protein